MSKDLGQTFFGAEPNPVFLNFVSFQLAAVLN